MADSVELSLWRRVFNEAKSLLEGWRWMYALLGVFTMATGIAALTGLPSWFDHHAPAGWSVGFAACALLILLAAKYKTATVTVRTQLQQLAVFTQGHSSGDVLSDRELLLDRLQGWKPNCPIVAYLDNSFLANQVDAAFCSEVEDHLLAWESDERSFSNAAVSAAFETLRGAVVAFYDMSVKEVWMGHDTHHDFYEMAVKQSDEVSNSEWQGSYDRIIGAAQGLSASLRNLFSVAHAERVVLPSEYS